MYLGHDYIHRRMYGVLKVTLLSRQSFPDSSFQTPPQPTGTAIMDYNSQPPQSQSHEKPDPGTHCLHLMVRPVCNLDREIANSIPAHHIPTTCPNNYTLS